MTLQDRWFKFLGRSIGTSDAGSGSDDVATETSSVQAMSLGYGYDGTTWDRLHSGANDADAKAEETSGILATNGFNYGHNGTTWDRLSSGATDSDDVAELTTGVLNTNDHMYGFDGTTWDRIHSTGNSTDNQTATAANKLEVVTFPYAFSGAGWDRQRIVTAADALSLGFAGLVTIAEQHSFNGTTYDRTRGNTDETILASAARTTTTVSADFVNYNAKGIKVVIDVTAISATPSVVFEIQGKDDVSGKYVNILQTTAVTGVSTNTLTVYPGITPSANLAVSDIIPRTYRIVATHADADSITYSVGGALVV